MDASKIRAFRKELGYSMGDFALCVGVPKSTYQRYEDGTAQVPPAVVRAALELQQVDREFFSTMGDRIKANLPHGICPNEARP